jgi:hypothetical protein
VSFIVNFDKFWSKLHFLRQLGSINNKLKLKIEIEPPSANLACLTPWNTLNLNVIFISFRLLLLIIKIRNIIFNCTWYKEYGINDGWKLLKNISHFMWSHYYSLRAIKNITGYCYHFVYAIAFGPAQSNYIMLLLLYLKALPLESHVFEWHQIPLVVEVFLSKTVECEKHFRGNHSLTCCVEPNDLWNKLKANLFITHFSLPESECSSHKQQN